MHPPSHTQPPLLPSLLFSSSFLPCLLACFLPSFLPSSLLPTPTHFPAYPTPPGVDAATFVPNTAWLKMANASLAPVYYYPGTDASKVSSTNTHLYYYPPVLLPCIVTPCIITPARMPPRYHLLTHPFYLINSHQHTLSTYIQTNTPLYYYPGTDASKVSSTNTPLFYYPLFYYHVLLLPVLLPRHGCL